MARQAAHCRPGSPGQGQGCARSGGAFPCFAAGFIDRSWGPHCPEEERIAKSLGLLSSGDGVDSGSR
jgi:hypothetical protein